MRRIFSLLKIPKTISQGWQNPGPRKAQDFLNSSTGNDRQGVALANYNEIIKLTDGKEMIITRSSTIFLKKIKYKT